MGVPGEPLALVNKNRKVLVPTDIKFEAADHDMCIKANLSPTVMFDINCPEDGDCRLGNFYKGNVKVVLKESTVHPSAAFQHTLELICNHMGMRGYF